ncbi:MAG: hypothetical protein NTW50_03855 [Candidatus Berkelbacteria bacterium]|nr:hypothetical protein [Candidatus Berkelbacteria bacterium]
MVDQSLVLWFRESHGHRDGLKTTQMTVLGRIINDDLIHALCDFIRVVSDEQLLEAIDLLRFGLADPFYRRYLIKRPRKDLIIQTLSEIAVTGNHADEINALIKEARALLLASQ